MTDRDTDAPFSGDLDYLDAECRWLRVRTARLSVERRAAEHDRELPAWNARIAGPPVQTVAQLELRRRLAVLRARERRIRKRLDEQLAAHRRDPTSQQLGLDKISEEASLSADERLVLLALSVTAVGGSALAEDVLGGLEPGFAGGIDVETLGRLLDARTVEDWLRVRALVEADSPLVRHDLLSARVSLSERAFERIVGAGIGAEGQGQSAATDSRPTRRTDR